jgi:hypothetical protein
MQPARIAVYAISLNEERFVDRFMENASEADIVVVADTGSTDATVQKLRLHGASVHQISIQPWRFDDARNAALALIPAWVDVCVVVDLDEVLEPGWALKLRAVWDPAVHTRGRYFYVWNHEPDGSPGISFWADRVHSRRGYRWIHPVHETLTQDRTVDNYVTLTHKLEHWADNSKSRGQYLPLLELAAKERPDDPRTAHYLGREYVYRADWAKARVELTRHIELPGSTWTPERAASMRHLAKACLGEGDFEEAIGWSRRATEEAPELRETWVDYAQICHNHLLWDECYWAAEHALTMTERPAVYLSEPYAWGSAAADLGSVAAWHLGKRERAIELAELAHSISPDDQRIVKNLDFFRTNLEEETAQ